MVSLDWDCLVSPMCDRKWDGTVDLERHGQFAQVILEWSVSRISCSLWSKRALGTATYAFPFRLQLRQTRKAEGWLFAFVFGAQRLKREVRGVFVSLEPYSPFDRQKSRQIISCF